MTVIFVKGMFLSFAVYFALQSAYNAEKKKVKARGGNFNYINVILNHI